MQANSSTYYLDLSSFPPSLSLLPLLGSSSFFSCEHQCLLQVMNASSLAPCLGLDTLKLPQAVERRGKKNLKIAFGLGFFWANGCPLVTLLQPPCHSALYPPSPPLFMCKDGRWVIDGNSADFCYFHTYMHTHMPFPPLASSLFLFLSSSSHMNNAVPKPEWGQESNGETYCGLSANGPSIIKGHALADATLCQCVHVFLLKIGVIDHLIN